MGMLSVLTCVCFCDVYLLVGCWGSKATRLACVVAVRYFTQSNQSYYVDYRSVGSDWDDGPEPPSFPAGLLLVLLTSCGYTAGVSLFLDEPYLCIFSPQKLLLWSNQRPSVLPCVVSNAAMTRTSVHGASARNGTVGGSFLYSGGGGSRCNNDRDLWGLLSYALDPSMSCVCLPKSPSIFYHDKYAYFPGNSLFNQRPHILFPRSTIVNPAMTGNFVHGVIAFENKRHPPSFLNPFSASSHPTPI